MLPIIERKHERKVRKEREKGKGKEKERENKPD